MPDTVAERTIADEPFLIPRAVLALLAGLLLAGCQGPASTLDPAGRGADDIALLFRIMAAGAADYDPDEVPFRSAYIGDADGLLSDGSFAARIN